MISILPSITLIDQRLSVNLVDKHLFDRCDKCFGSAGDSSNCSNTFHTFSFQQRLKVFRSLSDRCESLWHQLSQIALDPLSCSHCGSLNLASPIFRWRDYAFRHPNDCLDQICQSDAEIRRRSVKINNVLLQFVCGFICCANCTMFWWNCRYF